MNMNMFGIPLVDQIFVVLWVRRLLGEDLMTHLHMNYAQGGFKLEHSLLSQGIILVKFTKYPEK